MTDESNEFGSGEFGGQFSAGAATDVKTLIDDVLRQCGISTGNSGYREVALSFFNQAYKTILKGRHWRFMNKELFIELDPPHALGEVVLTSGGHTVAEFTDSETLPTANWNVNYEDRAFVPNSGDGGVYRIIKVPDNQHLEIVPGYAGVDQAATSYTIYHDRILLDAKVQDIKSLTPLGSREMRPVGLQEFRTKKASFPDMQGTPEMYTVSSVDSQAGQQTLEVWPHPDKRYSFHVEYNERITRLEDSETCFVMIPPEHEDVLILHVRSSIYVDQNNPTMAQLILKEAKSAWSRMASDVSLVDSRARLQNGGHYFRRRRGRYHGYYGLKYFGKID